MVLKTVTCSGANEHTNIEKLVELLLHFPHTEIGVQVSRKKASFGSERYFWLIQLFHYLKRAYFPKAKIALHINQEWVEEFCDGNVPYEINEFLTLKYDDEPFIKRVQLNFKIGREKTPDAEKLIETINRYQDQRFILSYNEANADFINDLHKRGLVFDCLYDNSHGEGVLAQERPAPVFADVFQGYAGGISPENVKQELQKIAKIVPKDCEIFIDAEGKLKGEDKIFSLEKCLTFLMNAYSVR